MAEKPKENFPTWPMELIYKCTACGLLQPREQPLPARCPECGAPKEYFMLVTED